MEKDKTCFLCKDGPCDINHKKCHLWIPLGIAAAMKNSVGLIEGMYAAGFVFDKKTDSFILRRA